MGSKQVLSPTSISGVFTALVTPFSADGTSIDIKAFEALVDWQISSGVSGLVACGTTGEAPTLSESELCTVVQKTVQIAHGRVPVIAGAGSFSTHKTIATSQAAIDAGADGVMIVMPYYSKPSQAGLVAHVTQIAAAVKAPIILYNIPGRTGVDLSADATASICERAQNVIGIKDATGNVLRCQELVRRLGDRLTVMSGDDALTLPMMACGARGLISTTSNVLPAQVSEVCRLALAGKWPEARRAHLALLPVYEAMFCEPSPGQVKAALAKMGRVQNVLRPPLVPVSDAAHAKIIDTVAKYEARA
jgi:4-hydroxy-tetrahydrodipicolinate synthase